MGEYRKQKRCPNLDQVQRYLDDLLAMQDKSAFEAHLADCPDCQKAIKTYAGIDDVLEEVFGKYKDIMRRLPDLAKAKNLLGYEPEITMEEAVKKIIKHRRKEVYKK